jgi:hypothetical protein
MGSRGIAPLILNLTTRRKWVVSFMPWPLFPPGRKPSIHWIGKWVNPRANLDILERKKKSIMFASILVPNLSPHSLVTIWTTLSQLLKRLV